MDTQKTPIENFVFNDIILYAKGWYERSENIFEDLGYLFSKIYGWTPKTEQEIARFMMLSLDKLCDEMKIEFKYSGCGHWCNSHARFEEEVCRRMNLYDVSREKAVVLTILSIFFDLTKEEIKLNCPHYGKKEHFRLGCAFGGKYPISMTYTEMNRRAKKIFK